MAEPSTEPSVVPANPPLDGISVLDVGTMTPGKYCTFLLADLGADVIRIERPQTPSMPISDEDLILNRNKRSMVLNLRTDEARKVFHEMARNTDVVLESHRPGATRRMGIDYDTIRDINPGVIYAALSGFGQNGPYRNLPAFDLIFMAVGGLLGLIGGGRRPPFVPGIWIADAASGLLAVIGVLTAVISRQRTGRGQFIDIAMLDCVLSLLSTVSGFQRSSGEPAQSDMLERPVMPGYNVYETADGGHLALGAFRPQSWQALCRLMGREDFIEHQWSRGEKRREILAFFKERFRTGNRDEWCRMLREIDVEAGPVHSLKEVFSDPHVRHRRMVTEVVHPDAGKMKQIGIPLKFSDTPGMPGRPAPHVGRDTESVLKQLGYSRNDIERLHSAGAI
jgi:crotonobetainyl-CoA:carnitine CoA-transferase CaiB-like acyl-CoA transferase